MQRLPLIFARHGPYAVTLLGRKCPNSQKHPLPPYPASAFSVEASLVRFRPERNEWRYYRMEIWPDLFGRAMLMRQ